MPKKCGNCKKIGHNCRTCEIESPESSTSNTGNSELEKNKTTKNSEDSENITKVPRQDRDKTESPQKAISSTDVEVVKTLLTDFNEISSDDSDQEQRSSSFSCCTSVVRSLKGKSKVTGTADWKITIDRPKKLRSNFYIRDTNEVLIRILQGPSKKDGPGYIYMYKIDERFENAELSEELKGCYKIGMSEDLPFSRRIPAQKNANKENYVEVTHVPVAWRKLTEKVIHLQLHNRHYPRNVKDGGTEWFKGDLEAQTGMDQKQKIQRMEKKLKEVILDSKKVVQSKWGGEEPKEGL
ncbi:unnamed protein product [Allacma fusca]|uniref:Bacteriophage T5 Orf172 DNA-binding domain-containing protein n=1 Tax=Allacma fusca TaxID=39272 RepID=A0A8J2NP29_9HEXA|nr:unnamed protein product [Allacma fusca]